MCTVREPAVRRASAVATWSVSSTTRARNRDDAPIWRPSTARNALEMATAMRDGANGTTSPSRRTTVIASVAAAADEPGVDPPPARSSHPSPGDDASTSADQVDRVSVTVVSSGGLTGSQRLRHYIWGSSSQRPQALVSSTDRPFLLWTPVDHATEV